MSDEDSGYDATKSDMMSEIDEAIGPFIERAVQKWLPREQLRHVRRSTVKHIADLVLPPPAPPIDPAASTDTVANIAAAYREAAHRAALLCLDGEITWEIKENQSNCRG